MKNEVLEGVVVDEKTTTGSTDMLAHLNAMSAKGITVDAFKKAAESNNPNQPKLSPEETKFKIQAIRKEIDKIRFSTMPKEDKDNEIAELNAIIAGLK